MAFPWCPLIADAGLDWGTVATAIATVAVAMFAFLGVAIKAFIAYLKRRELEQREHERQIMAQVKEIADAFDKSVRESRRENMRTVDLLLTLQKETIKTVQQFGSTVRDLKDEIGQRDEVIVNRVKMLVLEQVRIPQESASRTRSSATPPAGIEMSRTVMATGVG